MSFPGVCSICQNLGRCDKAITWDVLQKSTDEGCAACRLLQEGIYSLKDDENYPLKIELVTDMSLFVYTYGHDDKLLKIFEFFTLQGRPVIWPMIGPARQISRDSSSDDCIDLAKRWLSGCLSSHSDCRREGTPALPSRVIDVGSSDANVRLYVTSSGKRAEYAALSHCWGEGKSPCTLTKKSLEEMQQRITFDDNSRTFRDAVNVTRRLGIPYLWIDSLCILQDKDDISDWEIEAPKMSSVYSNATVTISSAASTDTSGGLFPNEDDRKAVYRSTTLSSTSPSGIEEFVYVRTRNVKHFSTAENVHSSFPPEKPRLRTRGWVLQEDCLSPRMLQFRKEELAWICSTYSRCECRVRPAMPLPHPFRAQIGTVEKNKEHLVSLQMHWPSIVMDYTRRNLTKESDRVAALSGLANYIESQTTDTYYCGIWYEDMAYQLLWYVDHRDCRRGVESRFAFPYAQSWSWTSVPGPVSYYDRYPRGSAPRHSAMRSRDTVKPCLNIVNVGRMLRNEENSAGEVIVCATAIVGHVVRAAYHPETKTWEALDFVEDFDPANLRVNIDTLEDEDILNDGYPEKYIMILAAQWVGQGMTLLPMQAVCILARQLSPEAEPMIGVMARFQLGRAQEIGEPLEEKYIPRQENSFERIGLVRGAGSLEAWRKPSLVKVIYLY